MSNPEKPLFSRHEHALEKAHETCPDCGAKLVIKHSKSGSFLAVLLILFVSILVRLSNMNE
jgi:uncharacterized protein (DUF983 family)